MTARIERLGETTIGADGKPRAVTVDDWVAAFQRRRAALVDHRCGAERASAATRRRPATAQRPARREAAAAAALAKQAAAASAGDGRH